MIDDATGASHHGWDPSDDLPLEELLHGTAWNAEIVQRCRAEYDRLLLDGSASSTEAIGLMMRLGIPGQRAVRFQRAIQREAQLTFEHLLIGLAAMDPTTAHGGVWNGLRAQYIFRMYNEAEDGVLSVPEVSKLLADVRAAYGTPSPFQTHEDAIREATQLIAHLGGGSSGLSLAAFRSAVGQLRVRGCSRLFRLEQPPFRYGGPLSDAASARVPRQCPRAA